MGKWTAFLFHSSTFCTITQSPTQRPFVSVINIWIYSGLFFDSLYNCFFSNLFHKLLTPFFQVSFPKDFLHHPLPFFPSSMLLPFTWSPRRTFVVLLSSTSLWVPVLKCMGLYWGWVGWKRASCLVKFSGSGSRIFAERERNARFRCGLWTTILSLLPLTYNVSIICVVLKDTAK